MRNVLVFTEHVNATYYIYFDVPLKALHGEGRLNFGVVSQRRVEAVLGAKPTKKELDAALRTWCDALRPDVVVMTRYALPGGVVIMKWLQEAGVPVVYHLDDDLLDIPESLGEEIVRRQGNVEVVRERRDLVARANRVYLSTAPLLETIRAKVPSQSKMAFGKIASPYQGDLLANVESVTESAAVIGYMGSKGHGVDLALAVPAIVRLMEENPTLRFETFGTIQMPAEMERFAERVTSHKVVSSYHEFLGQLKSLGWTIGLAPLIDAPFNRCKSATKFVEYTSAGVPLVASDNPVYRAAMPPGTGTLVGDGQWYEALRRLLFDTELRQSYIRQAQAHCRSTYSIEAQKSQVLDVLDVRWERFKLRTFRPAVSSRRSLYRGLGLGRNSLKSARRILKIGLSRLLGRWTPHMPPGNPAASQRVLFVANNFIPTLQLSFIKPLEPLINSGEMAVDVVSEKQMTEAFGGWRWKSRARKWMRQRFEAFRPTLVVFCRYSGPHGDALRDIARAQGVPVIYHIDDDLLNVPRELGAAKFAMHNDPRRLASVSGLLRDVDLVYCSTEPLRQRMAQHIGGQARAGKVYCTTDVLVPPPKPRTEVRVGYMGFDHAHDFEIVVPALVQLLKTYPNVRFELFGSIPKPAALDVFGNRVITHAPVLGYQKFMAKFASLGWNIGICPLADTPFNAVKANTKWVEYTSVGAAVVATGGTIYDGCAADGCGVLVQRPQDWYAALAELVESAEKRNALVSAAQARARQDYSLDSLRQQVLDVFAQARGVAQG